MSILKRVEEAYLGVLRLIIILSATLMLVAAVVFLLLAASNWREPRPLADEGGPAVLQEGVTREVLELGEKPAEPDKSGAASSKAAVEATPHKAELDRAAAAISNFVRKYGQGVYAVEADEALEVLQRRTEPYADTEHAKPFAVGLAVTMEKVLSDPQVIKLVEPVQPRAAAAAPQRVASSGDGDEAEVDVQPPAQTVRFRVSPIDVVNKALQGYVSAFGKELKAREAAQTEAAAEALQRKATAWTQLYMAGGIFGSFLLLVFISIVVKIERNLRVLAAATGAGSATRAGAPDQG